MSQIKQEIVVNWETFFWSAYPDKVLSYKTTEENRTCRKDLWAAFVFIFFRLFLFPMWWKENSDKVNKVHIQGDVFHFLQNS